MNKKFLLSILAVILLFVSAGSVFAQPPAPTNLSTGAITTSSVVLNWTGSGSNDSYIIAWAWGPTAPASPSGMGYHYLNDGAAETYTVTGIQAGQQMSFTVFSRASGVLSDASAQITVSTLPINTSTFTNAQPYSLIIGQRFPEGDCDPNDGGISAHSIGYAYDVFSLTNPDGTDGKYFVADTYNHRILIWNTKPTSNNQDADVVLGQPNFTSNSFGAAANQLNTPSGVCSDGTKLYVVDQGNNRVLVWNTIPTTNQAAANIVLGQSNFGISTPNTGGRTGARMSLAGMGVHGNGICTFDIGFQIKLMVCDSGNDRVLIWNNVDALFNGASATVVIGQANLTAHTTPTINGNNSTASSLIDPIDVAVNKDGKLIVLSSYEHRALIFNSIPGTNGASADNVVGKSNFSSNGPTNVNSATGLYYPTALAISKFNGKLAIANGNRVLIWNTFPAADEAPADNVLGGYATLDAQDRLEFSNQDGDGTSACYLHQVYGMTWTEDGALSMADGSRNSIVKFNGGDDVLHSPTSVTTGTVTDNSVELNWSGGAGDRYYIYYRYGTTPPTSVTDPLIANINSAGVTTGTSFTMQDMPCGVQFSFAVFAEKNFAFAPVGGTVNASTTSPASCINYPLLDNSGYIRQMITSITGDTIFAVGGFERIFSKTGTIYNRNNVLAMNAATGAILDWACNADGQVTGICLDKKTGSIYIGGSFNNVGGSARKYVAKINQDGSVNTGFTPPSLSDMIGGGGGTCMTLNSTGDTLYFWGQFTSVTDLEGNNFSRFNVCALVTADGSLSSFNTDQAYLSNATCRFFTLSPDGKSIFCGSNSGGLHLRSFSLATGESNFAFGVDGGLVACGWYDGSKYMYFAGGFSQFMGNTNVRRLAKVDMSGAMPVLVETYNNSASTWPGSTVRSIKGNSTALYMEGDFSDVGGTTRHRLAAVSSTDASLTSWNPNLSNNYSNGTAGNLFVHAKSGKLYYSMVTAPNNTGLLASEIPVSPSNENGGATNNVGAGATVSFSNEGGPIAELITGTSNLGSTTVSVTGANGDTISINGYTVMERILTVTPTTQPTDNVTVHIYALKSEMDFYASIHAGFGNAGNNYNGCKVHRLGTMNEYVQTFTPTITINGEIVDISFSTPGFSSFAMSDDNLLPVELSSFTSFANKNTVTLNWRTITETNNSGFEIERKKAGENNWITTGTVAGAGTSTVENSYKFEDRNVVTGKYNYRLKQIDFNGNYEYHNLANLVDVGVPAKWDLSQNYPNPFNPTTKINYDLPKDAFVKINIYDMTGRLISTLVETQQPAGYYTVNFNGSSLASGMYFYRIESENFVMTKKMVLVK